MSDRGDTSTPTAVTGIPENTAFYQLDQFDGLNTKFTRSGIGDREAWWSDNLMPVGPQTLVALADVGIAVYTATGGKTIVQKPQEFTINSVTYFACVLSDGSLQQVLADAPYTVTQVLPPATIPTPATTAVDYTQWSNQYLIVVADIGINNDGYWIWDGSLLYEAGTIGPIVTIGSGGGKYTGVPTINAYGGTGVGAAFTSTVRGGDIQTVTPTAPGSGYQASDPTIIALLFTGGGGGTSAIGTCTVADGVIVSVTLTDGGKGYTSIPDVNITDGSGGGASIVVSGISGGIITSIEVVNGGANYGQLGATTLSFAGGGGSGAAAYVTLANGVLNQVTMVDHGSGYVDNPTPEFISATGSGAAGHSVMSGDTITDVKFTSGGSGYGSPTFVVFKSAAGPAYATCQLMPFGVNGSSVVIYTSRVFIQRTATGLPPTILFSAPEDISNFGPPGGAVPLTDEFLRNSITHMLVSGAFLYLIGDSSVSYISGVSTSGSPAITTFSITNIDPQNGSPWSQSATVYGQSVLFANGQGIYAVYGGTAKKISSQLDGVYSESNVGSFTPSTAVADVNGVRCLLCLFPIIDPDLGGRRLIIFMWDGRRWWTYSPSIQLDFIFTVEIDSEIKAWGVKGGAIYPLFNTFSTIKKLLWTKLFSRPSIAHTKRAHTLFLTMDAPQAATLSVSVSTENGDAPITLSAFSGGPSSLPIWLRSRANGTVGQLMGVSIASGSPQFTIRDILLLVQQYFVRV